MEEMRTLNRDVVLSLADGVGVGDVPHLLTVCGTDSRQTPALSLL